MIKAGSCVGLPKESGCQKCRQNSASLWKSEGEEEQVDIELREAWDPNFQNRSGNIEAFLT